MIHTDRAVVVEGRYDRVKLDAVTDALVVTTDGFNIYRDKEKQALLRRLAASVGLVILTDSDDAGFRIRKFVTDLAGPGNALQAYIPEVAGKERRKPRAGSAGLLGVEGVDKAVAAQALAAALSAAGEAQCGEPAADGGETGRAGESDPAGMRDAAAADRAAGKSDMAGGSAANGPQGTERPANGPQAAARGIAAADLYTDGLGGRPGAQEKRRRFLLAAGLPTRLSTNQMLQLINRLLGPEKYRALLDGLDQETEE